VLYVDNWENLIVAMSTSHTARTLKFDDVSNNLMNEELRHKSITENQGGEALTLADRGRKIDRGPSRVFKVKRQIKIRRGRLTCYHCGKPGHMKKECRIWKREQKDKKPAKTSTNTNEGETIVVVSENEVLFTVSMEDACLFVSNYSIDWILDSGASHHVTPSKDNFVAYSSGDYGKVHLGNNHFCNIVGVGDVQIKTKEGQHILLKQVRHIPEMCMSLISVGRLDDEGCSTSFGKGGWKISKGALLMAKGSKTGTLYTLREISEKSDVVVVAREEISTDLWHKHLGHMSEKGLKILAGKNLLPGLKSYNLDLCEHCIYGRQQRVSFIRSGHEQKTNLLELIHSDVFGPVNIKSLGGASYFVTFIDDASRKVWAYPMKRKGEVFEIFQKFHVVVERETNQLLKCLRTDNGGEYCSNAFKEYCNRFGIKHEKIVPLTPQQNGTAERMNHTIMEKVRSMLSNSGLEKHFWEKQ
jgi:hypothetical protein